MAQVDRHGLFKGLIRDHAVSLTNKKKLPQFVCTLLATEWWDEVNETWMPWIDYQQAITGYFVLVHFDENGQVVRCLNYDQVMKATGWDGASFTGLATSDLKDHPVQFRVALDVFDGRTNLKVNWIDNVDAEIGLRKLSTDDLSKLDQQYGLSAPKPKPAGAPTPAPVPAPAAVPTAAPPLEQEMDKLAAPATAPKKKTPPKISAPKPPKISAPKPPESETPTVDTPPATCSMDDAWAACEAANEGLGQTAVPDEVLEDYWQSQAVKIAEDTENITQEEWAKIRDAVLDDLGIPF